MTDVRLWTLKSLSSSAFRSTLTTAESDGLSREWLCCLRFSSAAGLRRGSLRADRRLTALKWARRSWGCVSGEFTSRPSGSSRAPSLRHSSWNRASIDPGVESRRAKRSLKPSSLSPRMSDSLTLPCLRVELVGGAGGGSPLLSLAESVSKCTSFSASLMGFWHIQDAREEPETHTQRWVRVYAAHHVPWAPIIILDQSVADSLTTFAFFFF